MPCVTDVPKALRSAGPWELTKRVWEQIDEDNLFAWAAAMAYSWLFAFFPFLIVLLSLLPYLPEHTKASAKGEIQVMMQEWLPQQAADTVWKNVNQIMEKPRTGLLGLGLLLSIWGASGGMNMTITALERCYEIDRGRPFYKKRPVAIGLTLVTAALVISLLILLPVGTIAIHWIERHGSVYVSTPLLWTWKILRFPMALLLMFTVLNVLYHFGPSIRQRFVFATPGAVFCVVVWWILAVSFRFYVDKFGKYDETYGTVGGVAILLLFFYLDAVVLLIGAEINSEIDFEVLGVPRGTRDFTVAVKRDVPMLEESPVLPAGAPGTRE